MAEKRKWKHAVNLAITGGIYYICADVYLNSKHGQMTFSQALEYAYETHGLWVVIVTIALLVLFVGHVFWRVERVVWKWLREKF